MIDIYIKKLYDDVTLPQKKSRGASCLDIHAHSIEKISSDYYKIGFGFATEIPEGFKANVYPRSSISKTGWTLANNIGIIDSDYRGEWMGFYRGFVKDVRKRKVSGDCYLTYYQFPYKVGDRVAQFEIVPILNYEITEMDELANTERGSGGFGSTGK